jgi:hypothetical protein
MSMSMGFMQSMLIADTKPGGLLRTLVVDPMLLVEEDLVDGMGLQCQLNRIAAGLGYMDKQALLV